jgi:uncharacterized membrane protein
MAPSIIIVFAFFARLIGLNQSLWLDEATSVRTAHNLSYLQILQQFSPHDFHPPLFYWMLKVWTSFFGISEISARFPSVVFSLIAGYFVWKITSVFFERKQASIALLAFLFNPLIMYYSQEARMYMMVTMFVAMATYFTLCYLKTKSTKNLLWANITLGLCVFTFYGSLFFIAALFTALLYRRKYRLIASLLPGVVTAFIIESPLFFIQLQNAIPLKFATGRISLMPKILSYGLSSIWIIFLSYITFISFNKYKQKSYYRILLSSITLSLLLGIIASFFTPVLQYFRFIYLLPLITIIIGLGATTLLRKSLLLAGLLFFSFTYLLFPVFHREDWKSLALSIPQESEVYMIPSAADPLLYYAPSVKVIPIQKLKQVSTPTVTVIPYVVDIFGVDYRKMLLTQKYEIQTTRSYRGVVIEIWRLSPRPIYSSTFPQQSAAHF